MEHDEIRQLISAYIDGEANPEDAARVLDAIKSEKDLKRFYREIKKLRRNIKKLDDPAAYRAFQKLWRDKIGLKRPEKSGWGIPMRVTAVVTASLVVVVVGIYLLGRGNITTLQARDMANDQVTPESEAIPEMLEAPAAEEEMIMADETTNEAGMADESAASEAEAAAGSTMRKASPVFELPSETLDRFTSELETIGIAPVTEENEDVVRVMFEVDEETADDIVNLLNTYNINADEPDLIANTVTVIFN